MTTFNDSAGREWRLEINYTAMARVRGLCDGLNLSDFETLRIVDDEARFMEMLYVLCEDQAKVRSIDRGTFLDSLDGPTRETATEAFLDEFVNFTRPRRRPLLKRMRELARRLETTGETAAIAQLEKEAVPKSQPSLRTPVGDSPESSASTPAPIPFASSA
jgi:hypothetical protein